MNLNLTLILFYTDDHSTFMDYLWALSMGTNCFDSSAELYTAHSTPNHPCNPDPNLYIGNMQYQWVRVISIHQLNREKDWKKCS